MTKAAPVRAVCCVAAAVASLILVALTPPSAVAAPPDPPEGPVSDTMPTGTDPTPTLVAR